MDIAAYPGVTGGLLDGDGRGAIDDPGELLAAVERAGLRGRGGAGFPLAQKVHAVRAAGPRPVVVANGEEGEPTSRKDRWLMRTRPHLVLDGLRRAAAMVGADELHAYVSDGESARSLAKAATDLEVDLLVTEVAPRYVAGEETALVRAINGGPALPQDKPPRPFEAGIHGRPTLVSNVETLANLPLIPREPNTFLLTLDSTGLFEVPFGTTLREVLTWRERDPGGVTGIMTGGWFSGLLGPWALDLPLSYDTLREHGSGLGCGAVTVLTGDPVVAAAEVLAYFAVQNAGQCGSCFNGTAGMSLVLRELAAGRATPADVARLRRWSGFLTGRGACGTLDGASLMAASLLREFPAEVEAHVKGACR